MLQKLASEEGLSARIFKAIADPPTTSLQRLKVKSRKPDLIILNVLVSITQNAKYSVLVISHLSSGHCYFGSKHFI